MSRPINERLTLFIFDGVPRWDEAKRAYTPLVLIVNDDATVRNPQSWDGSAQLVGFADDHDHFTVALMSEDAIASPKAAIGKLPVLVVDGGFSTFPIEVTRTDQIHKENARVSKGEEDTNNEGAEGGGEGEDRRAVLGRDQR